MATIELSSEDENDCMIIDSEEQEDIQPSHFVCLKENELIDYLFNEDTSESNDHQSESQRCNPEFEGDPGNDVLETNSNLFSDKGLREEISEKCDLDCLINDDYKNNLETGADNISKQDNNAIFQRLAEALSTAISSSLRKGVKRLINNNDDKTDSTTKENRNDVVNANKINTTNELSDNTNNNSKFSKVTELTPTLEEKSLVTVKKRGRKPGWRKTLIPNPSINDTSLDSSMSQQKKCIRKSGWKQTPTLSSTGKELLQEMPTPDKKKRGRKLGWRKHPETNSNKRKCSKSINKCDQTKAISSYIGKPQVQSNHTIIGMGSEGEENSKTNVNSDDPINKLNLVSKSMENCDFKISNENEISRISRKIDVEQATPNISSDISHLDSSFTPQNPSLSHNKLDSTELMFQKSNTYINKKDDKTDSTTKENRNVDVVNANKINTTNELSDNTNNSSKFSKVVELTPILEEKSLVTVKKRGRKPGWRKTLVPDPSINDTSVDSSMSQQKKCIRKSGWKKTPTLSSTGKELLQEMPTPDKKKRGRKLGWRKHPETNSNKSKCSKSTIKCDQTKIISNYIGVPQVQSNHTIIGMRSECEENSKTNINSDDPMNKLNLVSKSRENCDFKIKNENEISRISRKIDVEQATPNISSDISHLDSSFTPQNPSLSQNEHESTELMFQKSNTYINSSREPINDELPESSPSIRVRSHLMIKNEFTGPNPPLSVQTRSLCDNEFPGTNPPINKLQSRLSGENNFPINLNPPISMAPMLTGTNKLPGYALNLQSEPVGGNMLPGPNPRQISSSSRLIGGEEFPESNPAVKSRPTGDNRFLGTNPDLNLLRSKQKCAHGFTERKSILSRLTGTVKQDEPVLKEDFVRCYNKIFNKNTEYSSTRLGDILLLTLKEVRTLTYRMNDAKKLTCELLQAKEIKIIEDSFKSIFDEYRSSFCSIFHEVFHHILSYEEEIYQHKALILALFIKIFVRVTTLSAEFFDSLILAKNTVKSMLKQYLSSLPTTPSAILRGTFWVSDTDFERNCWFILDFILSTFPKGADFSNKSLAKIDEMAVVETINQRLVSQFKSQLDNHRQGAEVSVIVRNNYHQEKQRRTSFESENSSSRHSDNQTTNFVEHSNDPTNLSFRNDQSTVLSNENGSYTAECTENNEEVLRNGDCRNIFNSKVQSFSNKPENHVTTSLQTHEHFLDYFLSDNPKTCEKNTNKKVVANTQVLQGAGLQYPVDSFPYLQQNIPTTTQASNASNFLKEELRRVNPPSFCHKERVGIGVAPNVVHKVSRKNGITGQLPNYDSTNIMSNASHKTREQFEYHPVNSYTQETYMDSYYKTIESSSGSIDRNSLNKQRSVYVPNPTVQPRVQQASSYHPHYGRRYHGFNYESPNYSPYSKSTINNPSQNQPNVATLPFGQHPNIYCTPTNGYNSYRSDPRADINRIKPVPENNFVTGKNMVTHNIFPSNLPQQRHNMRGSSGITINNYNINTCVPVPNMPEHMDVTLHADPYSYQHITRPYNM